VPKTTPELTGWESHRDDHYPTAWRLWEMGETWQSHPLQPATGPILSCIREDRSVRASEKWESIRQLAEKQNLAYEIPMYN